MLKCASAYTNEVDDPEVALTEIMAQLDKKMPLLKHSVGIVMCHTEFIVSGALKHICENLPFDLAGITTAAQAVNDEAGELILTVFVITSDDVWFKTGFTDSLSDGIDAPVSAAYEKAAHGEPDPPKLALIFPPFFMGRYAGDAYVEAWKKIIPHTPLFGTLAIDDTATFCESETIYNGVNKKDAMSFVLCYGNINPRFFIATLPENTSVSLRAEVTKSKENFVYEVNHINTRKFFAKAGIPECMPTVPFMIDLKKRDDYDGVPVISGNAAFTEDGTAVFYGYVDEGSTFSLASCKPDDILSTSLHTINRLNELRDVNGALLFPCIVRRILTLGLNKSLSELEIARARINPDIPFMMGYSGGEICPTSIKGGGPANRFHNYSLAILAI